MDGQVLIAASCIVAFLSYRYKARGGRPRKGSPASGFVANMGDQSPCPHPEGRNPPALTFLWKNRRFLPWRPLSLFLYGGMWYAKINEL